MSRRIAIVALSTALVLALLVPVGASADHPGATVAVGTNVDTYTPTTLFIAPGETVHWTRSGTGHRSHSVTADDSSWGTPATTGPIDFTRTFPDAGTYGYHCTVHGSMTGTVVVSDGSPSAISIADRSRTEGHSGTKDFSFAVTMDVPQSGTVTVDYQTADGTATAGSDYEDRSGMVSFPPGSTVANIAVKVNGDEEIEPDETFMVTLSPPSGNATLADGTAIGTIQNDDPPSGGAPPEPIADAGGPYSVVEGGTVTLDGGDSRDPEAGGAIVAYAWDVDGDGNPDFEGQTVEVSFASEGEFPVTLTVTDDDDQDATDETIVTVADGASLTRISGDDRILTAVKTARAGWATSEHALLATGFDFPDALSATALANRLEAPLLLTRTEALPPDVLEVLHDLEVVTVWILGGPAAVSDDVEAVLKREGFLVERLRGENRFETAREVALEVEASPLHEVVLALGQHADPTRDAWPDALSAGSLAAGPDRLPTLLTRSDELPLITERTLADLDTEKVWVLGGEAAISVAVEARLVKLGYQVERLAGDSRYGTTVAVAAEAMARLPAGEVPLTFATGGNFPDGLTAGAFAARTGGLVVLVHPTALGGGAPAVVAFLEEHASRFDVGTVLGGMAAVTTEVFAEVLDAMRR